MSYLVIARKYRPQKFSEVVGQEHVTKTLQNAIKMDTISHAYLFTGPRGIGKTTTARILAKAVNCENISAEEPCNTCITCEEITGSKSIDIIEIDAASNRGIEDIRELRKNVKYAPSSVKYKVYIIDEVHMLTKEAFNAILKTLEEPPPHVIFIMATTEPGKVLDTITSRCQTFNFKKIPEKIIKENLQSIAEKEKAEYEEEGLWMISGAADGSMRDGQSIMDQALSYSDGKIIADKVSELLGLIPREFLFSYTEYITKMDIQGALQLTDRLSREGYNLERLYTDLLKHFRNLMFAKVFGEATGFMGFDKDYSKKLDQMASGFSKEQLVWIMEFLSRNMMRVKNTDSPQVVLDTIFFKLCQKYVGYDDIMNAFKNGAAPEDLEIVEEIVKQKPEVTEKMPQPEETKTAVQESSPVSAKGQKWGKILAEIKKESQPLYHSLKEAQATVKNKQVIIKYDGKLDLTERQEKILKDKITEIAGEGYYPHIVKKNAKPVEPEIKKESEGKVKKKATSPTEIEEEEPVIGDIVEMFKGKIEK